MLSGLPTPYYLVFGIAILTLLTRLPRPKLPWLHIPWPKFKLQTEHQTSDGIKVTDVMLSVSGRKPGSSQREFEVAAYFVLKNRKR